jgi:beta-lactamase regulating signal transducer with metallopeptidase domain
MITLLSVALKVAVLTLAALAATTVLHRRSAAVRHFVLATTLICAWGVPLLERVLPSWPVPLPALWSTPQAVSSLRLVSTSAESPAATRPVISGDRPAASTPPLTTWLIAIWVVGAAIGCARLVAGLLRLRTFVANSEPVSSGTWRDVVDDVAQRYGVHRPVRILRCQHPTMLATWGILRPAILLPAGARDWPSDRVHAVVCHELAHVLRGDWVVSLLADVLRTLHWFNPLVWIACRRLRHESERACDDLVLASGISGAEYATHLLAVARQAAVHRHPWSPAIAIAHHSMLEGRVRAMLNTRVDRAPLTVGARATTVAALAAVTLSIGIVSVSGEETRQPARSDVRLTPAGELPVISLVQEPRAVESPAAAATPPAAQAQPGRGTIEGVLYDQFGGLLPGASVRLTQIGGNGAQNSLTDRGGAFAFRGLAAGDYELVTELPGFITVTNVLRAEQGQTTRRYITLPIGTIEETIHATCSSSNRVTSPSAPTGAASPGAAQRQAAAGQRGTEPKVPGTFTGGIGGQIRAPRKLAHVSPVCPSNAVAQSTTVKLTGRIGIDGLLTDLRDVSADPQAAYAASALEAVRQWVFMPTLLNDTPIEVNINITVSYSWAN